MARSLSRRDGTLVVLADGAQAAFAAAVVGALAGRGVRWSRAYGAGLGAHVALLALLGEAPEGRRRWEREAGNGCSVLRSRLDAALARVPVNEGVRIVPDAWTIPAWLDDASLVQYLAPELAGLPERLSRAGASCRVAVCDLAAGNAGWWDLAVARPLDAGALLHAAAAFCGGWAPVAGHGAGGIWCGGVATALHLLAEIRGEGARIDLVCGFPLPAVRRPPVGSVFELAQRRDEISAAGAVEGWNTLDGTEIRVIAPAQASWQSWAGRDGADLGLEYPLPGERNAELVDVVLRYGDFVVRQAQGRGP